MVSLVTCSLSASPSFLTVNPSFPSSFNLKFHLRNRNPHNRRYRNGTCKAELIQDAPFAAAIGACMLSSLVLPAASNADDDNDSVSDSTTDMRIAAMGIISFIPYFNWLGWVFAWLDSGKRRYAVYSVVYLIPYLRSNLSLSPEESWLPIASIIFCIVHVQLEASIRNGDIQGFPSFSLGLNAIKKHTGLKGPGVISNEDAKLPSSHEKSKDEPKKDGEHSNNDWEGK